MKKPFILALLGLLSTAFAENLDIPEEEMRKYEEYINDIRGLGVPNVRLCSRWDEYCEHVTEVENRVSARIRREEQEKKEKEEQERKKAEEDRRKQEEKKTKWNKVLWKKWKESLVNQ